MSWSLSSSLQRFSIVIPPETVGIATTESLLALGFDDSIIPHHPSLYHHGSGDVLFDPGSVCSPEPWPRLQVYQPLAVLPFSRSAENLANPTALLLSSVSMLHHLELHDKADSIQDAILRTIAEGKYRTGDLGGTASTTEFTIANHL
ncbi:Isocitrate dehydrogenase [NAD] catalytic subunit 5, mitochondrial [Capsicum chinense]|nr:Isocitrate dehydrogenase [NAD] catalytic subunit 5, mitochondrial [Capsicum chinense]